MTPETSIPFYIVFDDTDNDDIDSVISFNTATTSYIPELLDDSESRWDRASKIRREGQQQPHHPRRSISHDSTTDDMKLLQEQYAADEELQATRNNPTHDNTPNNGASPRSTGRRIILNSKKLSPSAVLNRTNRLTRMAERAKAVARTPVARRNSGTKSNLQRQLLTAQQRRRSMPPHLPLRKGSSSSPCTTANANRCSPHDYSVVVDRSYSGNSSMSGLSSSLSSSCGPGGDRSGGGGSSSGNIDVNRHNQHHRRIYKSKSMTAAAAARRRNSIAACIVSSSLYPPSSSRSGGLETILLKHRQQYHHQLQNRQAMALAAARVVMSRRASTPGCYHMSSAMTSDTTAAAAALNRPPRLPQRYPSEVLATGP